MIKKFEEFINENITPKVGVYNSFSELPEDCTRFMFAYVTNREESQTFCGFFDCEKLTHLQLKRCWENAVNDFFEIGPDDLTDIYLISVPIEFLEEYRTIFEEVENGDENFETLLLNVVESEEGGEKYGDTVQIVMYVNGADWMEYEGKRWRCPSELGI
jgi:hypothetical protein